MPNIELNGKFDENNISQLIRKFNFIFPAKDQMVPGYNIFLNITVKDFTSIASLVLYKAISFAIERKCLLNPRTDLDKITKLFNKYHLQDLILAYINKKDKEKVYKKITPVVKNDFFIAPHPISRTHFKGKEDIEEKYYSTITEYYKDLDPTIIDCLKTCIVEISSNFYYHATDDKSILMAEGTLKQMEIISVDTSEGIIATMRKAHNDKSDIDILRKAFQRHVSSKINQNHCGTGLWLVNEIVTKLKGKLILHTGGYIYRNIQGKVSIFESSFWQGTVLYVKIPITKDMASIIKDLLKTEVNYI